MWKKNELNETEPVIVTSETEVVKTPTQLAWLGPSLTIRGEVTGSEDLWIHGRVEGTINLKQNTVTVGQGGHVQGDIYARTVRVEGQVTGDCYVSEQAVIHKSGEVQGNIVTPRIIVEDGARLKGAIDTATQETRIIEESEKVSEVQKKLGSTTARSKSDVVVQF